MKEYQFEHGHLHIDQEEIRCSYRDVFEEETTWTLECKDKLRCRTGKNVKDYTPADIKEFAFKVKNRKYELPAAGCEAIAYVIDQNGKPAELCRVFVTEEHQNHEHTKAYELMDHTLKAVAARYQKPYSYNTAVWTEEKAYNPWHIIIFILVVSLLVLLEWMFDV
ncbi:hypothetical protein AB9P05_12915 [Roseivirga sp. BDSF3-8]|uniref:hypothetical protein n=1 Tax=Roseivirga sp. BDSF3-8 TaxID=3241598 RepID=UPI003532633D